MTTTRATVYPEPVYADTEAEGLDSHDTTPELSDEITLDRSSDDGSWPDSIEEGSENTDCKPDQIPIRYELYI